MSGTRVPYPFTGLSLTSPGQWTRGEPLDDIKLHQRIDVPLDSLGGYQRSWGSDFAVFVGSLSAGTAIAANTNINWTIWEDTALLWDYVGGTHSLSPTSDGLYLFSGCVTVSAATGVPTVSLIETAVGGGGDPRDGTTMAIALAPVNTGGIFSLTMRCTAGDIYAVQSNVAVTSRVSQDCWWQVRQLSY